MDQLDVIRRKIRETLGFEPKDLIPDGKVKRFSLDAANEYDDKGWYVLWENKAADGINLGCVFGDWRNKDARYKCFPNGGEQSRDEKLRAHIERQRIDAQQKRLLQHELAAQISADKWAKLPDDFVVTPYMKKKHIFQRFGCKTLDDVLYVPMRDITGKLWSIQRILSDAKLYTTNGRVQETFHVISSEPPKIGPIYLCEGFATGVSIHLATERVVVVTFDSGNLPRVAKIFRDQNPYRHMVICGDEDKWDKKTGELRGDNPGRRAAEQAGKIAKCEVIFPVFDDEGKLYTDFNDLHVSKGLGIVRDQLEKRKRAVPDKETAQTKLIHRKGEAMPLSIAPTKIDQAKNTSQASEAPPKKKKGSSLGEIHRDLVDFLEGAKPELLADFPAFPKKFESIRGRKLDDPQIIEIVNNTAEIVGHRYVAGELRKYVRLLYGKQKKYNLPLRALEPVVEDWAIQYVHRKEFPKPIAFLSDPELCLQRAPFDLPMEKGSTPLFDEMFSRIESNCQALKAYIWSLFIPHSFDQQYVWIYGDGNDGKGALARVLLRLFDTTGMVQNTAPWKGNKHWAIPFVGMRLIVFPDFKEISSLDNGIMKGLTGGDNVYVDPKGSKGYMIKLICKLLICSNDMPNLSGSKSDLRRPILARIRTTDKFDPNYEEILWSEFPSFLLECKESYEKLCPDHGRIPTDEIGAILLRDDLEDRDADLGWIFETHFKEQPGASLTPHQVTSRLVETGRTDPQIQRRFKKYLEDRGFKSKRVGSTPRLHRGIELRPFPRSEVP